MYHFYSLHRAEFLQHYHKRSNVETTFHMIKAKFGTVKMIFGSKAVFEAKPQGTALPK